MFLYPLAFYFLLDLAPEHFQRFRDKLLGVFGSFCLSLDRPFLIPRLLAQYASPLDVPAFTLEPPSLALPD